MKETASPLTKIFNYLKLIRIHHWIKNLFVFIPVIFTKHIFHSEILFLSLKAFLAFSFVSSIVYVMNDIADRGADKLHPKKKKRPLASGAISIQSAVVVIVILFILAATLMLQLPLKFFYLALLYGIINILYTFKLKHFVLIDIISIAAGFVIRVASGAVAINAEISSWLILTTMFISLYLAVMKRFSEFERSLNNTSGGSTRKVLEQYSMRFLDQMASVTAGGVILCYALYTMAPRTIQNFGTENLIYTTPFVVIGIFRYMHLVYHNQQGESTVEVMLSDIPMILTTAVYFGTTILIIYKWI